MHDALEGAIGQVGSIRVIGRSVRRYARAPKPIPDIARELNVDGVVTAGVTRSGDAVTLQVRLIRARPAEELLWAQDYNRHVRDVIAMHREVARTIAREARASVSADQESRLADAHPVNPRTYEAYLRGMALLNRSTQAEHQRGIAILEQVIAEDPGDALAYAGLSLGYATMGHGADPPPDAWQRARQTALRAVGLDPELAEAHAALADVKLYYEHDYAGAEREFRRANELNPSLAMNHYHYAWYLELMRRRDEAIEEHTRAQELDPLTPLHTAWLGALYYGKGRTDQGMAEAKKVLARDSMNALGLQILAEGYSRKRMHDSAIAIFQRAVSVSPASRWNLATAYIMAGRLDEARKIVAVLDSLPTNAFRAWNRALLHAQLGELDEAYRWAMYEPSHAWLPWFRTMDFMAAFRADPRYPEFLRRVKLPD
jgi:tetratricopeptide (TPR) repeat protein